MTIATPTQQQLKYYMYSGDRGDWPIVYTQHYDADSLTVANFRAMANALAVEWIDRGESGPRENADDTAAIESYGGAFGHGAYLIVRPGSWAHDTAMRYLGRLGDYPVIDEEGWSTVEWEGAVESVTSALEDRYHRDIIPAGTLERLAVAFLDAIESGDVSQYWDGWPDLDDSRCRHWLAVAWRTVRASRAA